MELYLGGVAFSLELIYAQVATLITRIDAVRSKAELLRSSVDLLRALGGRSNRRQLPNNDPIQPFGTFQYTNLDEPPPARLYVPIRLSQGWGGVRCDHSGPVGGPRPSEAELRSFAMGLTGYAANREYHTVRAVRECAILRIVHAWCSSP